MWALGLSSPAWKSTSPATTSMTPGPHACRSPILIPHQQLTRDQAISDSGLVPCHFPYAWLNAIVPRASRRESSASWRSALAVLHLAALQHGLPACLRAKELDCGLTAQLLCQWGQVLTGAARSDHRARRPVVPRCWPLFADVALRIFMYPAVSRVVACLDSIESVTSMPVLRMVLSRLWGTTLSGADPGAEAAVATHPWIPTVPGRRVRRF
jgi:hypothetical protein